MADRLEGRNPVVECLARGHRRVLRIWLDKGAKPQGKVAQIVRLAAEKGVQVHQVDRARLDAMTEGRVHNGVVAEAEPLIPWTTKALLDHLALQGCDPFWVLCANLTYEHNLGAVLRSSLGFGVNGVVLPTRKGARVSPVVQRVSMGAVEAVPLVREGMNAALSQLRRAGVRVVGADMGGDPMHTVNLTGPIALLLGSEGTGISPNLARKCDQMACISLAGQLESLNVSVAAALLMYEKRRQDGWFG